MRRCPGAGRGCASAGRHDDADQLAADAVARFEEAAIPHEVTAWLAQARARWECGDEAGWLEIIDRARRRIETERLLSLYLRCPEARVPDAARICAAMAAFAAGDALGVPWEGSPPESIDLAIAPTVPPTRWGWPRGATSDDTAQMLLTAQLLADTAGEPTREQFLTRLAAAADDIRGIGPTTRAALDEFARTGRVLQAPPGREATNGAAMRILPAGWVTPTADADLRRRRVETLAAGTHQQPAAIAAAQIVATMGAWALEGLSTTTILAAAAEETRWLRSQGADGQLAIRLATVDDALAGTWTPPAQGIGLDALETTAAVIHCIAADASLRATLLLAVSLGGDTDTVAALVGGILGAARPDHVEGLEWLPLTDYSAPQGLAEGLRELRSGWYSR